MRKKQTIEQIKTKETRIGFIECEEVLDKNTPFTYTPYKILEYIEGDVSDYIRYEAELVNENGNYTENGFKYYSNK